MSTTHGKLVLILGPSGVGKGTLVDTLRREYTDFVYPISVTTREPRPGEVDGVVYHFISDAEFEAKKAAGELLEWAIVHATKKYGTLKSPIMNAIESGKTVIREIDIQGYISVREKVPAEQLVGIFISPPDLETIKNRIARRQPDMDPAELAHRLDSAEKEMAQRHLAKYEVVNREGEFEKTLAEVLAIIRRETSPA